jgi:hypothetical protein
LKIFTKSLVIFIKMSESSVEIQQQSIKFQQKINKINLYSGSKDEVIIPIPPKIPFKDGLDVEVRKQDNDQKNPKDLLRRMVFAIAIAIAKAIAESSYTRDFWANKRITNNDEIHVFGRVPEEDSSWRKPVKTLPSPQEIPPTRYKYQKILRLKKITKAF